MLRSLASLPCTTLIQPFSLIQYVKPLPNLKTAYHKKSFALSNLTLSQTHINSSNSSSFQFVTSTDKSSETDWEFSDEEDDDEGSPWKGAVMYKRNATISNLEYCTTLERLGLGKLSSEVSRSRASEMGLRVLKSVKDYPDGTPVLISFEVIRKKQKLRLDGIIRTVLALNCNRCGDPAAQSVYSEISILLCEEPIQKSENVNMGIIFGEDKSKISEDEVGDEDSLIDPEDKLYFPVDVKVVDISKNIRDLIHVEITLNALCGPNCKGMCLKCGNNLNKSNCLCRTDEVEEKGYGPLGNLRKQMQQT